MKSLLAGGRIHYFCTSQLDLMLLKLLIQQPLRKRRCPAPDLGQTGRPTPGGIVPFVPSFHRDRGGETSETWEAQNSTVTNSRDRARVITGHGYSS